MSTTTNPQDPRLGHGSDTQPKEQNETYLVLSPEEVAKGFVRPYRDAYIHDQGCGTLTRMNVAIAATYARDPHFYGSTYCVGCRKHRPVGPAGEFTWEGTTDRVGT